MLRTYIVLYLICVFLLTACGGDKGAPAVSNGDLALTEVAEKVSMGLTQTAAVVVSQPSPTLEPTQTVPSEPPTQMPMEIPTSGDLPTGTFADATALPPPADATLALSPPEPINTQAETDSSTCKFRASLEWENVPDGTEIPLGKEFTKTWRLKNVGTCDWPVGTELAFISGEIMGANSRIVVIDKTPVPVNSYLEVNVVFKAPNKPGTYRGNWMLVVPYEYGGRMFGIGENGKGFFWIEIVAYQKQKP